MTDLLSIVFIIGASLLDLAEAWSLAIIAVVVVIDLAVGRRVRAFMWFGVLQIAGLGLGYAWVVRVGLQQDVSGPYAAAFLIGAWCILAVAFHTVFVIRQIMRR